MAIVQISIIIFIFTLMFIIFSYSKTDQKVGIWIVVMIAFTFIIGLTTTGSELAIDAQRINPVYLIGKYSKYNV